MAAKDNKIISVILQISRNFSSATPEAVLYGCAKLLLMSEVAIKSFLDEGDIAELEQTRRIFSDENLELGLIKNGSLLLNLGDKLTDAEKQKYYEFERYLAECDEKTCLTDIIKKAIVYAVIPLKQVYGEGCTLDDVFAYQDEIKARTVNATAISSKEEKEKVEEVPLPQVVREEEKEEVLQNHEKGKLFTLSERYRKLSASLYDVIKGQDHTIAKFVQGCYQGELLIGKESRRQPQAYFFFFGPPGVGKTFLAETAAENLGRPYKLFNMSEYSSKDAVDVLLGISSIYKNAKEGILLEYVRKNPNAVLIFDEIEKANIAVIRLFLQILGSGRAFNVHRDEETSFEETLIIFTSNVGKELYADRSVNLSTLPESVVLSAIRQEKNANGQQVLPDEICSRIASGNMLLFNHLSMKHLAEMTKNNFDKVVQAMEEKYKCRITYAHVLPLLFLYSRGGENDARMAINQSANFMKSEIFKLTRHLSNRHFSEDDACTIHFDVEWSSMEPELSKLFVNDKKTELLVLADESVRERFKLNPDKYQIHFANNIQEAREYLAHDIIATFIDPFYGKLADSSNILSITDYNTEGVKFFYELAESATDMNIYLLEVDKEFAEVDRKTFVQNGATATMQLREQQADSFIRLAEQTLDDVYMERVSSEFANQGWVIDFKSKQNISKDGRLTVLFYDLKRRQAIDSDSRDVLLSEAERPAISFDDVIGAANAKAELKYFVEYLKNPKRFVVNGGRPPKGVLLYGPPGTGKTMLAKAMAGEGGVTFIETSASEFMDKYVGESEANVRRLFTKARKYAPAIIFIDEIDAIGKQRTGSEYASTRESVLNTLLTEMDGFSSDNKKPIFVLAATNYGVTEGKGVAKLDEALVRRFDNKIYVDLPNKEERLYYLKMMMRKKGEDNISEEILENIADRTTGQSLAIVQNVLDLAFRSAVKENRAVLDDDLLTALEEYMYGEKRECTPEYYRSVAIHEVGHAYISYISGEKPSYITIESRGDFGGYMQYGNSEDVPSYTREDLIERIRTSLAGRASEQVFLGEVAANNTGAASDLKKATHYAFQIICTYGMEPGQLITLDKSEIMQSSVAGEYIKHVNSLLQEEMKNTIALIEEGREKIQTIVDVLVARNHLTGDEFAELMEK